MVLDLQSMKSQNDGPLSHVELNMWAIPPRGGALWRAPSGTVVPAP